MTHVYADEHAAALSAMALVTCMRSRLVHRVGDKRVFLAAAERHTLIMR